MVAVVAVVAVAAAMSPMCTTMGDAAFASKLMGVRFALLACTWCVNVFLRAGFVICVSYTRSVLDWLAL